jgi:hypothetical protein
METFPKTEVLDSMWIQNLFQYSHFFIPKAAINEKTSISNTGNEQIYDIMLE